MYSKASEQPFQSSSLRPLSHADKKSDHLEGALLAPEVGSSRSPDSVEQPRRDARNRKRNAHACTNCRIRKTKCDGGKPCARCVRDDDVCEYAKRSLKANKNYSQEYIESIFKQNEKYKKAMRILYSRIPREQTQEPFGSQRDMNEVPPVHEILRELGLLEDTPTVVEDEDREIDDPSGSAGLFSTFDGSATLNTGQETFAAAGEQNFPQDLFRDLSDDFGENFGYREELDASPYYMAAAPMPPGARAGYSGGSYSAPMLDTSQAQGASQASFQYDVRRQENTPEAVIANSQILMRRSSQRNSSDLRMIEGRPDLRHLGRGRSY